MKGHFELGDTLCELDRPREGYAHLQPRTPLTRCSRRRLDFPPSYFLEVRRAGTIAVLEQEPQLVNRLHQELCDEQR